MIEGQGLELVLGEDPGDLALEGEVEGEPAAAGVGQEHPSRLEVTPEPGRLVVGPVELVVTGHVQERIAHGLRVLGPDVHLLELDGQRRVIAHVLQQVMDRGGVGIPVAVVDELGEDEIIAAGDVGFMVDLGAAEEPAELIAPQQVGHVIGADLSRLIDDDPEAAGMVVAVPAAGQVGRRIDHGRPASDGDPLEAGCVFITRAIRLLIREVAQLVIGREQGIVRGQLTQGAVRKDRLHRATERLVEVFPAAAGVSDDHPPVQDVTGQRIADVLGDGERIVPGEEQGG